MTATCKLGTGDCAPLSAVSRQPSWLGLEPLGQAQKPASACATVPSVRHFDL